MKLPHLSKELNFAFKDKPLLIGGVAKEYYGIRKAGEDIDFVISKADFKRLVSVLKKQGLKFMKGEHQQSYRDVPELYNDFGDRGIFFHNFEIWDQIVKCDYALLSEGALEKAHVRIISLDKLLYLTAFAIHKPKYLEDLKRIVKHILKNKYS